MSMLKDVKCVCGSEREGPPHTVALACSVHLKWPRVRSMRAHGLGPLLTARHGVHTRVVRHHRRAELDWRALAVAIAVAGRVYPRARLE
eukprot:5036307-Prymnesium_polylepis.1